MKREKATMIISEEIADGIISSWMETPQADEAECGQFVMINTLSEAHLLGRPISICDIDRKNRRLRLVYRKVGFGTSELSRAKKGQEYEVLGPLGNGFPVEEADGAERIALIGGGIGAPPLLALAKALPKEKVTAVLGYRSEKSGLFLKDEFDSETSGVLLATDDGSAGCHGTVIDVLDEASFKPDLIYACGPMPMLSAVKAFAEKVGAKAFISLEERMACGVGACLGCVVKSRERDEHSRVHNKRICTEGPVFDAEEVEI